MPERVCLVSSDDPNFNLHDINSFNFSHKELTDGMHVIKVNEEGVNEFIPWLDPELRPSTVNGNHAMIQIIMHLTANRFNITMEQLCGQSKRAAWVDARKISAYLCCEAFRTPMNFDSMVGRPFIDMIASNAVRKRSMISYYDQWVRDRLDILPDFVASISSLKEQIISRLPIDEQILTKRLGKAGL